MLSPFGLLTVIGGINVYFFTLRIIGKMSENVNAAEVNRIFEIVPFAVGIYKLTVHVNENVLVRALKSEYRMSVNLLGKCVGKMNRV